MSENSLWAPRPSDALLSELLDKIVEDPTSLTTKDLLRPVFKWLKYGSKHYAPDKAFELAEWTFSASCIGDAKIGVPALRQLQPSYVYNTIVTMSQRNNRPGDARRAHECMRRHGLEPDIFSLTALLDVVGRGGDLEEAYRIYEDMLRSERTLPNVVTYCTLLRLTSKHAGADTGASQVRRLLSDATGLAQRSVGSQVSDQNGVVDSSIYNAALAASVRYQDKDLLRDVLCQMRPSGADRSSPLSELSYEIICKFFLRMAEISSYDTGNDLLLWLQSSDAVTAADCEKVRAHAAARQARGKILRPPAPTPDALTQDMLLYSIGPAAAVSKPVKKSPCGYVENMSYLGPKSPDSLRTTVLSHDLTRLAQRLLIPTADDGLISLCETDFVTIIHQCRKRKWFEQVGTVTAFMRELCMHGLPDLGLPATPVMKMTMLTVESALETFFAGGLVDPAWKLFETVILHTTSTAIDAALSVSNSDGIMSFAHRFPTLVISGFIGCMSYEHATRAYFSFRNGGGGEPSPVLVKGMLRASGRSRLCVQAALTMLAELVGDTILRNTTAKERDTLMVPAARVDLPIVVDIRQRWVRDNSHLSGATNVLNWEELEACIQTLMRSCALLSGSELTTSIWHFLTALSDSSDDISMYCFEPTTDTATVEWVFPTGITSAETFKTSMLCMSECLQGITWRWDSFYMTTLLMAPCSKSVGAVQVCTDIHYMISQGALPSMPSLFSLALEALGHSWSPDKIEAVVFEAKKGEGSLPFRSFVLIGVLKYLEERSRFLDVVLLHMAAAQTTASGVLADVSSSAWIISLTDAFCSDEKRTAECHDPILAGYLQAVSANECSSLLSLLFLQHCYARFSNVKTKVGKDGLEQHLHFMIMENFSSFRALWSFTCLLLTNIHLIGGKSDEKVVVRFCSFLLSLLLQELQRLCETTDGVTVVSSVLEQKGKPGADAGAVVFYFMADGMSDLPQMLGTCVVRMVQNAIDSGRGPFDFIKTTQKSFAVLGYEVVCQQLGEYLSRDISSDAVKPFRFSQIIDFIISYRSYLITHLKLNRLEIILAEQLQIDASYYKAAVEYMCYMVPSESDSPLLHRWESCERIVHLLLTAREARVKSHGTSESTLEYRDAAVLDLAVKLLFKLHPVTQEGRKDARSTAERRAAIDAVIDMYPNLSKACCSPDADSAEVLSIFGQRTETVRVTPDEKLMYFELPISRDKVVIVNDMDSVTFAAACLLNRDRIDIIGIDTEWRPMRNSGAFNKCSVLQIACRSNVFLFDLMVLEPTFADFNFDEVSQTIRCFRELIQSLLASDTVLKLGYGLRGDFDRLRESFPDSYHYCDICNFLDLKDKKYQQEALDTGSCNKGGLSALLRSLCGFELDKSMQVSDWAERPLSEHQILYAAKDAFCLICVWDMLNKK